MLNLDLHRSVAVGRGYLTSEAYPDARISLLKYVPRLACRVLAVNTEPPEFEIYVPKEHSLMGLLFDADGNGFPTQHIPLYGAILAIYALFTAFPENAPRDQEYRCYHLSILSMF